jgi:hypothetical protein
MQNNIAREQRNIVFKLYYTLTVIIFGGIYLANKVIDKISYKNNYVRSENIYTKSLHNPNLEKLFCSNKERYMNCDFYNKKL